MTDVGVEQARAPGQVELLTTVFACGAAVMTIEVVGTRIIGPVFGVGLYVWAALLVVTLASLATGYYVGGILADRRPNALLLMQLVAGSGGLLAVAPLFSRPVLALGESLGVRVGPVVSAALLFAPSLITLGMTAPVAVRLGTKSVATAGRGIGSISAASTFGSLVGTLLVGFLAIPAFDARAILAGVAVALIALGGLAMALRRRGAALGLLLLPLLIGEGSKPELPPGLSIVAKSQSLLGLVEVIADQGRGVRFLRSDHSVLGAAFERDGSSAFGFVNVVAAVRFLQPTAKTCLNIGLGTGAVPTILARDGLRVDVIEIDPAVVQFARQYFDYRPNGHVEMDDARTYLQRTTRRYDIVIHDTFTGGATPEHLLSLEVLQRIKRVLTPGGVLALNFVGYYAGPEAEATYAVARTLNAAFLHVRAYRDSTPAPVTPAGNIIFFASERPLAVSEPAAKELLQWPALGVVPQGEPITDAKNPLARLQIPIAEKHFEAMNELLPAEVWLN